jgi:phage terminase large subunit-like protein
LGKPFKLLPWQKWVILALFTVGADGLRTIRWALIGIAKKNGKTELAAALALFFAFGPSGPNGEPEPAALVIVAAGSDEQADMVFGAAKTMAEHSPTLSALLEPYEDEILCPELPGSKVKRVAAAAKKLSSTLDGKNIYVVICDELHCWEGPQAKVVWDTLTNGTVTRLQPLVLQITTAGVDSGLAEGRPETLCGQQYAYGKAVATGEVDDPAYLFWWVEAPAGADHNDPAVIEAANPSFGRIMQLGFYLDQLTKKTPAVFRRYFLNQWTEAKETWLPEGAWEALSVGEFEFDAELPMYGFTDAATKHDSTAHVRGQWHDCTKSCPGWDPSHPKAPAGTVRKLRVRAVLWERPFDIRTHRPLEGWKLPIAEVENVLREYHRSYNLLAWGYDPALFERSAQQLEAEGLPMEEVPQSDQRMVPAAQALFQLVVDGELEHDGDKDFARHMRNAVAVQARGGDGGWRLKKGAGRMDAAISAAGTALLATQYVEEEEDQILW